MDRSPGRRRRLIGADGRGGLLRSSHGRRPRHDWSMTVDPDARRASDDRSPGACRSTVDTPRHGIERSIDRCPRGQAIAGLVTASPFTPTSRRTVAASNASTCRRRVLAIGARRPSVASEAHGVVAGVRRLVDHASLTSDPAVASALTPSPDRLAPDASVRERLRASLRELAGLAVRRPRAAARSTGSRRRRAPPPAA